MPVKHSRHVALTEPLGRLVDDQVAEGHHATVSEAVRAALRLLQREAATQRGSDATPGTPR